MSNEKPLFIPLRTEFYEAFERGEKCFEYRQYGPRWNESTCRVGRRVTLSKGYGKAHRISGKIVSFARKYCESPGFVACFGEPGEAAIIGIVTETSSDE